MTPLTKIVILFAVVVCLHFLANILGIYDEQIKSGFVWFDDVLHILVGIGFGLLWLWMVGEEKIISSNIYVAIRMMIFVFIMALTWEILEFGFFKLFTSHANALKLYSPSIQEALTDIFSNIIGGFVVIFWKK